MEEPKVERASFVTNAGKGERIPIHFNPVSLEYSITNTLQEHGEDKKQYVAKSTAKLTMDLIFDTTDTGTDVRLHTQKIAKLMEPTQEIAGEKKAPEVVMFDWGTFQFRGMVESYKETIDFFAPGGVPLRAAINLSLTRQEKVFENERNSAKNPQPEPLVTVPVAGETMTDIATTAGNPTAGRNAAAWNNQESMRFLSGAIALSNSLPLNEPVAFTQENLGGSGDFGGLSPGLPIGSQTSAGISASKGAFAGLRNSISRQRSNKLEPNRLLQRSPAFNYATGRNAQFQLGGQANIAGASGLNADVGVSASLQSRIQFERG